MLVLWNEFLQIEGSFVIFLSFRENPEYSGWREILPCLFLLPLFFSFQSFSLPKIGRVGEGVEYCPVFYYLPPSPSFRTWYGIYCPCHSEERGIERFCHSCDEGELDESPKECPLREARICTMHVFLIQGHLLAMLTEKSLQLPGLNGLHANYIRNNFIYESRYCFKPWAIKCRWWSWFIWIL